MGATLILTLITAIAGSVTSLLSTEGVLPSGVTNLINVSISAGVALFNAFKSGGTVTNEVQASLAALQAEYTAIQQNTSADPVVLGIIAEASNLVSDAITGYTSGIDPSTEPVPPEIV